LKSRGQASFVEMPSFGAKLYSDLTRTGAIERQQEEIARDLVSQVEEGRLLDVGTGPGTLLLKVHEVNPRLELHGLDVSEAMAQLARTNLAKIGAKVHCGDILRTDYEDGFFDVVTCTGSFYLWDDPEECLDEVFRILKKGGSALLYETHQDVDTTQVRKAVKINLEGEGLVRKLVAPGLLMKQLRMTYRASEVADIVNRTSFADNCLIEQTTIAGLPVWLRIHLAKPVGTLP
jgi:ubiquinone/menaquinone biosynthesis C-methylase UbiE